MFFFIQSTGSYTNNSSNAEKIELKMQKKQRKARTAFTDHQLQVNKHFA
jgi:hypothetical protein